MLILNTLAPIFLMIVLGVGLRRWRFLSAEHTSGLNRLAYWVALPAMLFHRTARAPFAGWEAATAFLIVLIGTAGAILAAFLLGRLLRLKSTEVGTFVQGAFRGNLAYIGLAVVVYGFGEADTAAEQAAIFTLAPMVVLYNVVAVVVLLASRHTLNLSAMGRMGRGIATNPLILACLAGGLVSWSGWEMPSSMDRTLTAVSGFTLPAALLAIGATIATTGMGHHWRKAMGAVLVKVALAPAIGLLVAMAIGAGPMERSVAMIMLACPTAIASYVLADQLGGDAGLTASIIVLSTLLSFASLSIALAMI